MRAQATALCCTPPASQGAARSHWSVADLAAELVGAGRVASVHPSTLWRWLQAERLKPWRYHLWQRPRLDAVFLERARAVLRCYEQAPTLYRAGTWVVCCDEKTSIQAREGIDPPQAAQHSGRLHVAARYHRRGAVQLVAGLSVVDGKVYGTTRRRKQFADFQAFLLQEIVPEAERRQVRRLCLLLDNGPTHAPKQLQAWLERQRLEGAFAFEVEVVWLPTYASWLDQIELWFSILQRKLLRPNHFRSVEELEQRICAFIGHYNERAGPIKWSYTVAKFDAKFAMN